MNAIMIDLETLSSANDAAIIQIGAIAFNPSNGYVLDDGICLTVDFEDALKYGSASGSTLAWWFNQNVYARQSVLKDPINLTKAIRLFNVYFYGVQSTQKGDVELWSHATFDATILAGTYARLGIAIPWKHRMVRDIRTLNALAKEKGMVWVKKESENTHNALDDARYQVQYVSEMYQYVTKK